MLDEIMIQLQPIIINAAIVIITTISGYVGLTIKKIYKEKADNATKKAIVKDTVKYINQIADRLELTNEDKLQKAKVEIAEQLQIKGIQVTDLELTVLIEAAINGFKQGLKD